MQGSVNGAEVRRVRLTVQKYAGFGEICKNGEMVERIVLFFRERALDVLTEANKLVSPGPESQPSQLPASEPQVTTQNTH